MRHQTRFRTAHQGLKSDMNPISAGVSVVEAGRMLPGIPSRTSVKNKTMEHFNDTLTRAN